MGRWYYEEDYGFGSVIGIIFVLAAAVAIIYIVFWVGVIGLIGYLIYLIVNYFRNKNQKEKELEKERKRKYEDYLRKNKPEISCEPQALLPPLPPDFYVFINDERYGPYNITQLSQMRQRGQFKEDTLVWKEGMKQWTEARSCCELLSVFGIGNTEISFQEWKKQNPGKSLNDFYATKRKN